jgi:hypothetical protein
VLGLILTYAGEHDEAERVLREAMEITSAATYTRVTLALAVARAGDSGCALDTLALLQEKMAHDYVSPVELATLHIALGNTDAALDWAERAHAERRGWMAYLNVHPVVDPIRNHPRFEILRQKMRL